MKTALIVIDVQNDYFPGGKLPLHNMNEVAIVVNDILDNFRKNQHPVFHVQHIFLNDDAPFFVANTKGADIHASIKQMAGEALIVKHAPNSFHQTELDAQLKKHGIEQLVIVGAQTQICIDATVKAAADLGYKVKVISDASAARDVTMNSVTVPAEQINAAFFAGMNGIFADVITSVEWLNA
jgi:nicotinamidase-related amidase